VNNSEADWDKFPCEAYLNHNYGRLRSDDDTILQRLAAFYDALPAGLEVVEVGTGPNLYPVLAALPVAKSIDIIEYPAGNLRWLRQEIANLSDFWQAYWMRLSELSDRYAPLDPKALVAKRVRVNRGSIFNLPSQSWDVGSMHFVAESITSSGDEFRQAVHSFLRCLRFGGHFVAALMENSTGYRILDADFPAYPVDSLAVEDVMNGLTADLSISRIELPENEPLRAGYTGMLFVTGRRADDTCP